MVSRCFGAFGGRMTAVCWSFAAAITVLPQGSLHADEPLRVAAAISLKEALTVITEAYETRTGTDIELVFGSSGQLLAQIRSGAPIDVYISAAAQQADAVEHEGLARSGTRRVVAGNRLVLIAPTGERSAPAGFRALADRSLRRLAIGEPATVPAGQYAAQVLDALNLTDALKERLVYGTNVRQVLAYVQQGEVTAGIVYASDARAAGDSVRVIATADAAWHAPIVYPALIIKDSRQIDRATQFLDHLTTDDARRVFVEHGFSAPARSAADASTQPANASDATPPGPIAPSSAERRGVP